MSARASIGSTTGSLLPVEEMRAELKRLLLKSPVAFCGKPCVTIAVVGLKGTAKSTFVNTLLGVLSGGPHAAQRSGGGAESASSTTQNALIPLHQLLFGDADPPCYFWLWDTVGLVRDRNKTWTTSDVAPLLSPIVGGTLRFGSTELVQIGNVAPIQDTAKLPAQGLMVCLHANEDLGNTIAGRQNEKEISFLHSINAVAAKWPYHEENQAPACFQGFPVYSLVTCVDQLLPNVFDAGTGADNWEAMRHSPEIVLLQKNVSSQSRVPYNRCYATFGLDTLKPRGAGREPREQCVLLPVLNAVREIVSHDALLSQQRFVLQERQRTTVPLSLGRVQTLPHLTCLQLQELFSRDELLAPAAAVVKAQSISGQCLISLNEDDINKFFEREKHVGLCWRLNSMIQPYRLLREMEQLHQRAAPPAQGESADAIVGGILSASRLTASLTSNESTANNNFITWNGQQLLAGAALTGNKITLSHAGTYQVTVQVSVQASNGNVVTESFISLYLNGDSEVKARYNDTNSNYHQGSTLFHVGKYDAGAALQVHHKSQGNNALNGNTFPSRLYIVRIQ